ncbi:putative E3 ubiquitin-protein ligase RHG1A isoform X1 [Primulina tabacum]|uniref:putative E3 ubiquitin-protein ligase RHG1A isoform X1 n=1 Tax=Primulina tabacum TaxID=48773 RepID=UPI003F5ABEC0
MQGQRSSVSAALPSFDLGLSSVPSGIDSQISWNSMQTSAQNFVPEYRISSSDSNISYLPHVRHDGVNGEWSAGSSSAAQNQGEQNEGKTENIISTHTRATLTIEERQFEQSNFFSFDIPNANPNDNYTTDGLLHARDSSSEALLQDLNMSSGFGSNEDDDVEIIEHRNTYASVGSSNGYRTSVGGSSDSLRLPSGFRGCAMEESEYGSGSLDGQRASCKRKIFEVVGESSGAGSSNSYQNVERSQWTVQSAQLDARNNTMPAQISNNLVINNGSERSNSRLRIDVGEAVSAGPFSLNPSRTAENSLRNFSLRSNGRGRQRQRQDQMPVNPSSTEVEFGSVDGSSSQNSSRLVAHNRLLDLNPSPVAENGSVHGQSALLQVPFVRRNLQSRWNEASSSRTNGSFASTPILGERDARLFDETAQRNIPISISDHRIFIPDREMRSSSRYPINWNFASGNNNIAGNAASTSQVATSSGLDSASPNWSHRRCPQYPQRLSEIVRRSLLSSAGTESGGGQSSNLATRTSSPATSQEMPFTFRPGSQGQRMSNQRSALLDRRREGAFGTPNSLRVFASATEGRTAVMSEQIRRVLDLMRRGEALRLEDLMILDNSVFFGMADLHDQHDRHRDMRLDVDNMTYEELLALEERIGNVCTGLTEEVIISRLKDKNYVTSGAENPAETEPCSICREEYSEGVNLGTLDCGHDFHKDCIKQWLLLKNLCPICKTTGLKT